MSFIKIKFILSSTALLAILKNKPTQKFHFYLRKSVYSFEFNSSIAMFRVIEMSKINKQAMFMSFMSFMMDLPLIVGVKFQGNKKKHCK